MSKRMRTEDEGSKRAGADNLDYTFASRYTAAEIPKYKVPANGLPANVASQLIEDERQLDSNPRLNLASFGKCPSTASSLLFSLLH